MYRPVVAIEQYADVAFLGFEPAARSEEILRASDVSRPVADAVDEHAAEEEVDRSAYRGRVHDIALYIDCACLLWALGDDGEVEADHFVCVWEGRGQLSCYVVCSCTNIKQNHVEAPSM